MSILYCTCPCLGNNSKDLRHIAFFLDFYLYTATIRGGIRIPNTPEKKMPDNRKKTKRPIDNDLVEDKEIAEIESDIDEYLYSETKKKVGVKNARRKQIKKATSRTVSLPSNATGKDNPQSEAHSHEGKPAGKSAAKRQLSWRTIIALRSAKIVFGYIPLAIISIVFVLLIIVKIVLQPAFVEKTAIKNFNKMSNGTLSMKVRSFNPYRGFVIEDVVVKNSPEYGGGDFVTVEKIVFDYQFFSIFTGKVRFNEIGIYKPKIALLQKKGEWNAAKLMKPSPPKKEEKEEEKKEEKDEDEEKEALTELRLPISVSFFLKFVLSELSVSVVSDDFRAHVNDFTVSADIDIPPFKRMPLSPEAVKLIRLFDIKINPKERLDAGFVSEDYSIPSPLLLTFNLFYSGEDEKNTRFYSTFRAGTSGTAVRVQNTALDPINFNAAYKLNYNPVTDYFNIETFGITFAGDRWLDIKGFVDKPVSDPKINIAITESNINLDKLYPYARSFINDSRTFFSGNLSLAPLSVTGNFNNILADGKITLKNFIYSMQNLEADLPDFVLGYRVNYKETGVFADTTIDANGFRYTLGRDRSGRNNLSLALSASSTEKFSHHQVRNLSVQLTDPVSKLDALSLAMKADARTGDVIKANVDIEELVFRNQPLQNMVNSEIAKTLKTIPLKKPLTLSLQTNAEVAGQKLNITLDLGVKVPDYDVYDMRLSTALRHDAATSRADIERFRLSSASYGLECTIAGFADYSESPLKDSDLRVRLAVQQDRLKDMYGGWNLKGLVSMNAHMRGNNKNGSVSGNILIKNLDVEHKDRENPDAKIVSLSGMNLDFPYEYRFMKEYTGLSKITRDKASLITNDNFKTKRNFTIDSVKIAHPSRPKQYLEVVNGLNGTMQFKNNSFDIVNLQASVLGGSLTMKDTLFYLADFSVDNMEYNLGLDIVNMNMGRLDRPDSTATDAYLSLTSSVSGKGVDFSKKISSKGNINIYKVGEKVAGKLMKGLQDEKGRSKIGSTQTVVDNTMSIQGFDFYMDGGNVYTTVKLDPRTVARASGIRIQNNQIKYDRIPIQEFMRSVQEE